MRIGTPPADAASIAIDFPGNAEVGLTAPAEAWARADRLTFRVHWPEDAPSDAQVLVFLTDPDFGWFQHLVPDPLEPGLAQTVTVPLDEPGAWSARGHQAVLSRMHRIGPQAVGVRIFGRAPYRGTARIEEARLDPAPERQPPPVIDYVQPSAAEVPRFERVEIRFRLPDRYLDPFDEEEISVEGLFEAPDGTETRVDGFFFLDHYRVQDANGEQVIPLGRPGWAVRFAPMQEGEYRYRIRVRDRWGSAEWGPGTLRAGPARSPGFVRVSAHDPRFLEYSDGTFFFPIGHNIRSTFDTRHDTRFPWEHREQTGTAAYRGFFESMSAAGSNFVEVWMASWSLGLEWTPVRPGYRGIGWFNLRHAWELDRVVDWAEELGLHINLVIHNHGKFSDWVDAEWEANPFNVANGGYLRRPEQYFTDRRAKDAFRKLMRYIIARWGSSRAVFSWELWNELDLTGSRGQSPRVHQASTTVDWHAEMGRWIRERDPYGKLMGSHVSGDYRRQHPDLLRLEEIDFMPINAYHGEQNPLHVVDLLLRSADFGARFEKPLLVTEFGGTPMASQGVFHLEDELFAALWASTVVPVAGTPLFWWWHLIDEEGWYGKYAAIARFMEGVDRRDPEAELIEAPVLEGDRTHRELRGLVYRSPRGGTAWVFAHRRFPELTPDGPPLATNAVLRINGLSEGPYEVEFWDTVRGERTARARHETRQGRLDLPLPPFARDLALKLRHRPGS